MQEYSWQCKIRLKKQLTRSLLPTLLIVFVIFQAEAKRLWAHSLSMSIWNLPLTRTSYYPSILTVLLWEHAPHGIWVQKETMCGLYSSYYLSTLLSSCEYMHPMESEFRDFRGKPRVARIPQAAGYLAFTACTRRSSHCPHCTAQPWNTRAVQASFLDVIDNIISQAGVTDTARTTFPFKDGCEFTAQTRTS